MDFFTPFKQSSSVHKQDEKPAAESETVLRNGGGVSGGGCVIA